jgi:hypothetical protein
MSVPSSVTRWIWSLAFVGVSDTDDYAIRPLVFEDRGEIELKGKGRRHAYLLVGRLERPLATWR